MNLLYQSAFFEALGWSLADSLWKTGALWILYVLLTSNGQKFTSTKRYFVALSFLAIASLWTVLGFIQDYSDLLKGRQVSSVTYYLSQHLSYPVTAIKFIEGSVPLISAVYLFGLGILLAKFLIHYLKSTRTLHCGYIQVDDDLLKLFEAIRRRMGITKKITIWLSSNCPTALTFGWLRPVILLPVAALNRLSIEQTEAIIAHELLHIRRNDYFFNLLIVMSELVFFFNPFARMLTGIIRKERENACDDEVLALGYDSWQYAESLYILGTASLTGTEFALGVSGANKQLLLERVKRILHLSQTQAPVLKPLFIFLLCLLGASLIKHLPEPITANNVSIIPVEYVAEENMLQPAEKPVIVLNARILHPKVQLPQQLIRVKIKIHRNNSSPGITVLAPAEKSANEPEKKPLLSEDVQRTFVSVKPERIEFTIIETSPVVPEVKNGGKVLPYVPASTFYFPDIKDSVSPSKKIVSI